MFVRDIMQKKVLTTSPDTSIREAARIMTDSRVGCLVVTKNDKITGIITERDIMLAVAKYSNIEFDSMPVSELMSRYVIQVSPGSKVQKAVELMVKNKIKKIPVVEDGRIVGIITSTDVAAVEPEILDTLRRMIK